MEIDVAVAMTAKMQPTKLHKMQAQLWPMCMYFRGNVIAQYGGCVIQRFSVYLSMQKSLSALRVQ